MGRESHEVSILGSDISGICLDVIEAQRRGGECWPEDGAATPNILPSHASLDSLLAMMARFSRQFTSQH